MRNFTLSRMPRAVVLMEALGGIMLLLSYFVLHQMLPLPASFSGPGAVTIVLLVGVLLMLPAAVVIMWRTAKAMAPELFHSGHKPLPGEKHDADH